jgi:hypothetical protein
MKCDFHLPSGMSSNPADKEEISASFGKQIFAVPWTGFRFPFPGPLNFFTASGEGGVGVMFLKKFMQRLGTVMVLSNLSKTLTQRAMVILAICLTSLACYLILKESGRLLQVLRQTGINVLTRLMGLLLAVVAIQFVIDGIKAVILEITSGR